MNNLDISFDLLSTMSPKFKSATPRNKLKKSPHTLAIKSNIRKSAAFDKSSHSVTHDSSVILINDSFNTGNNVKILKKPIIISSTSESDDTDLKSESKSKYFEIDNWLSDNEKLGGHTENFSFKNNLSDDEKNIFSKQAGNSSQPTSTCDINKKMNRKDSSFSDDNINDDMDDDLKKSVENILDNLYGNSWRLNKKDIFTRSEPRKQRKKSPVRIPKTEKKPKQNAQKTLRYKNICSSESDDSFSKNIQISHKKLEFSDSEDEIDKIKHKTPSTPSNKSNFSSDSSHSEMNFSDSENESLETRVRKKLAKKAKPLRDNKTFTGKIKVGSVIEKKIQEKLNTLENRKFERGDGKFSFLQSLSGGVPSWKCHPEAQFYKSNFRTEKFALATKLFALFNATVFDNSLPAETPIEWSGRMRGTAGFCYSRRITKSNGTVIRSCRLVLATKILDSPDRVRDTLIHEMCHAATWIINGVADGHGPHWRQWANTAMEKFPELPLIKRCHNYVINTKYTYKCVNCGYSVGRHSKSLDIERKRCGHCYGKFECFLNKQKKNGEKQLVPSTPKGKPTAFALFVKENYAKINRENLKHADVMKMLGKKFSEMKMEGK